MPSVWRGLTCPYCGEDNPNSVECVFAIEAYVNGRKIPLWEEEKS